MKTYMLITCSYLGCCKLILEHIEILQRELEKSKEASLLELKSYYWIIEKYDSEILCKCHCKYKEKIEDTLKKLVKIFQINGVKLDINKKQCDICKILPCEMFSLLDLICSNSKYQDIESVCIEIQYHIFLAEIYDKMIGRCTKCNEFGEYLACLLSASDFVKNKDMQELQRFVYSWKIAVNTDQIINCYTTLTTDRCIQSKKINLDNHIIIYLDFNIYNCCEKKPEVSKLFERLMAQNNVDIVCSGTHLEEILRMNNKEYELKRLRIIQKLTNGKIIVVDDRGKMVVCEEKLDQRFFCIKKYREMNEYAEQRECIEAEAREKLSLHVYDEQRNKEIGMSSIKAILANADSSTGKKKNLNLPDEDELNKILMYEGIGKHKISEYKDMFKNCEKEFKQINSAIVSMARLLNVLGLHGDKIRKKNDANAVYPIYTKKSYRTIRSGYYDNDHLSFASKCTYFVTTDVTLCKKAIEIYEYLGIRTIPVTLDEFVNNIFHGLV